MTRAGSKRAGARRHHLPFNKPRVEAFGLLEVQQRGESLVFAVLGVLLLSCLVVLYVKAIAKKEKKDVGDGQVSADASLNPEQLEQATQASDDLQRVENSRFSSKQTSGPVLTTVFLEGLPIEIAIGIRTERVRAKIPAVLRKCQSIMYLVIQLLPDEAYDNEHILLNPHAPALVGKDAFTYKLLRLEVLANTEDGNSMLLNVAKEVSVKAEADVIPDGFSLKNRISLGSRGSVVSFWSSTLPSTTERPLISLHILVPNNFASRYEAKTPRDFLFDFNKRLHEKGCDCPALLDIVTCL